MLSSFLSVSQTFHLEPLSFCLTQSFRIGFDGSLSVVNSARYGLSINVVVVPLFIKASFAGCSMANWYVFPENPEDIVPLSRNCHQCWWDVTWFCSLATLERSPLSYLVFWALPVAVYSLSSCLDSNNSGKVSAVISLDTALPESNGLLLEHWFDRSLTLWCPVE